MDHDDRGFYRIRSDEEQISMSVRFGRNVKIGWGVVIDEDVVIGDDVFIGHNTVIRSNVTIGSGSIIGHLVMIESDTSIGNKVTIQSQCHITKNARISDQVFMGPMAMCINTRKISHGRGFKARLQGPKIGYGARIGSGAILMPGVQIGKNAVVGAGAVIDGKVGDREVYFSKQLLAQLMGDVEQREVLEP
jgi:UDP-2-acetamido-3-amino-2,3-dideoxy-glucuronate N-acetyltransferase